ncbi:hypothetical protein [Brucella pseudogrignonensis]|uniref:hypothetical protein n=1 Tax=Brucella pseudogrignonensis TaxID=419475 RepID=UPI000CFBE118|nr:hypothetical protein [Brucella pseudogrignonensis]MQP42359.1 hypothetical protein [Ochrobactrum sp. MYb237]PQZ44059.1 hypothetical protein CQ059_09325 [Brucella pseudogrignonensis]PRA38301.1 hypothetical protein CQ063_19180 [Brucella pseudogrignonensis]PRA64144.1 hypothetical protein CQ055_19070 [Brucella pseudogrignonensis]
MRKYRKLHEKLDALTLQARPPDSLAARLEALSDNERETYYRWLNENIGRTYEDYLNGNNGTVLPRKIRLKLFDEISIAENTPLDEISETWNEMRC